MKYIIDFYKELDTFNTILFWGVIIVILLLLIFSIIMVIKNRKLEEIIESNGINIDDDNELPIKQFDKQTNDEPKEKISSFEMQTVEKPKAEMRVETEQYFPTVEKKESQEITNITPIIDNRERQVEPEQKPVENHFVAEEYVMNNEKNTNVEFPKIVMEETSQRNYVKENKTQGPYQRNVLRGMSLNQTSPIGIAKIENHHNIELNKAAELQNTLSENNPSYDINNARFNDYQQRATTTMVNNEKERYLKEVSDKLAKEIAGEKIQRTPYEMQQEADAIISYRELMKKKDNLHMVDDEEAVISIEELRKRNNEKLYNITEETENNKFIDELKNFRSDL